MDRDRRTTLFARVEQVTEIPMLVLAFVFLIIVLLPEIMPLSLRVENMLEGMLWLIWGVFAVELGIKTYLAPDRRRYLVAHWPDVLTVALPFLRPLRLLRIFVVVARAWKQTRSVLRQRTLSLVGLTSLITIILSATFVYAVERRTDGPIQTYVDALWWAVTTITTVGYGDMYPTTNVGRGVAVFLMLTGIALFGLLTASIAAFFVEEDAQASKGDRFDEILERLNQLERTVARQRRLQKRPRPKMPKRVRARKSS
jgi:voltage-gated potassium channel